jgi:hypothetical protein
VQKEKRKKHAFITAIYSGLEVDFLFNTMKKKRRWWMTLRIGDGFRSREIGFESKDWVHSVAVQLNAVCGCDKSASEVLVQGHPSLGSNSVPTCRFYSTTFQPAVN